MIFADPLWGILLLAPLLMLALARPLRRRFSFGFGNVSRGLAHNNQFYRWLGAVPLILRVTVLVLLAMAIMRPQDVLRSEQRTQDGIDIVLVVDTSGSMRALDFELNGQSMNRLAVVKSVLSEFIGTRESDRIGMVVFGTEAYTQAPLTYDHRVLLTLLDRVQIGMAGDATAIGDALATATKRIKDVDAKSKVIILLTDGANTAGSVEPLTAASAAKSLGARVYTIGAGSKGKVPMPVKGFFGMESVQMVESDLDEDLLTKIAETTGGKYFRAYDTDSLKQVYQTIDELEKRRIETPEYRKREERFAPWVMAALMLLAAEMLFSLTPWRRVPV
jgi:Ca-activated chloride channel family protein